MPRDLAPPLDLTPADLVPLPPDLVLPAQCLGDLLAPPTCNDEVRNQDETDVDCGGGVCPKCADGEMCLAGGDCTGGLCQGGRCVGCADGVKDQDETDIDCGGLICRTCAFGKRCLRTADCLSGACVNGVCAALASCSDGKLDGSETDTDCGGGACAPCATFQHCATRADCATDPCSGGMCVSCHDKKCDGDETDVDCGGSCPPCYGDHLCKIDRDCVSQWCRLGRCAPLTTCHDGMKDLGETDVDCGGPACRRCGLCNGCNQNDDCLSGNCVGHVCGSPPGGCGLGMFWSPGPCLLKCTGAFWGVGSCQCDARSCDGCCGSPGLGSGDTACFGDSDYACGHGGIDCAGCIPGVLNFCISGRCEYDCGAHFRCPDDMGGTCCAPNNDCNPFDDANCAAHPITGADCAPCPLGQHCAFAGSGCQ